ncbi:hypothetical protein ABPG72_018572 [Tetrahymena utriculariae]
MNHYYVRKRLLEKTNNPFDMSNYAETGFTLNNVMKNMFITDSTKEITQEEKAQIIMEQNENYDDPQPQQLQELKLSMERQNIRSIFLFQYNLGENASKAAQEVNNAFGDKTTTERTAQRWYTKFRSGDMSVENQEGQGRKPSIDNEFLKGLVEKNPRTTLRELAEETNTCFKTVHNHLKEINKVKKLDKWVPHELNQYQQNNRKIISEQLLKKYKNDPFLSRLITCDEKWILFENSRRSGQWLDKDEAPKHMPKPNSYGKKIMITVWWLGKGIVHYSFLEAEETINGNKYCQELQQAFEKTSLLYPGLVNRSGLILLHDNARPHICIQTKNKLKELGIELLPHPAYSPDLAPTDFHLFKHLDSFLADKIFKNKEEIKLAFEEFIKTRPANFFAEGIEKLPLRWEKCIQSNGKYFD